MFKNAKYRKRLRQIGSCVDVQFLLYVNNEEPMQFADEKSAIAYLKNFRKENEIFKIQMYRIESYSL